MKEQLQINMETHWKRAVSDPMKTKARVARCYDEGRLVNPFKFGDTVLHAVLRIFVELCRGP